MTADVSRVSTASPVFVIPKVRSCTCKQLILINYLARIGFLTKKPGKIGHKKRKIEDLSSSHGERSKDESEM